MAEIKNILVVDDFETVRVYLKDVLKGLGFDNIYESRSAEEARELISSQDDSGNPIDVVFADWGLPGESGLDLLKSVRATDAHKETPFIMVTSQREKENVAEAMKEGCTHYVKKPFSDQDIEETIRLIQSK